MQFEKICDTCGHIFIPQNNGQKMCCDCAQEIKIKLQQKPVSGICIICGKPAQPPYDHFCGKECICKAHRVRGKAVYEKNKQIKKELSERRKKEKLALKAEKAVTQKNKNKRRLVDDMAMQAKQSGVSYGRFVATLYMKNMKQLTNGGD